jgi:microcystin-dependent protein
MPSHVHALDYQFDLNSGCHDGSGSTPCASGTMHYAEATGNDQHHNTMQPYRAVNYIIYGGEAG